MEKAHFEREKKRLERVAEKNTIKERRMKSTGEKKRLEAKLHSKKLAAQVEFENLQLEKTNLERNSISKLMQKTGRKH